MKQIVQNLRTGETILEEVPAPQVRRGHILIQTSKSLVSAGTEKMLTGFAKASLIEKAILQPERVKEVFNKIKTDGMIPALKTVVAKLDQSIALGYCNVGKVIAVGGDVCDIAIGDRVISNGSHAEVVCVARNLVARIPDKVTDIEAVFTVIGAIGLHATRLLMPSLGETVVVMGLGLIGLLTADLLHLSGCSVIGIDPDEDRLKLAKQRGIITLNPENRDTVLFVRNLSDGIGADGVIITASAISDDLISQAAKMCRKRGSIILTGVTGMTLSRDDFYEKELTFQVSCSYGPGRYDPSYEEKSIDYPVSYVRWTENRNFRSVLQLMESGSLDVKPLITEVFPFEDCEKVYQNMASSKSLATIFEYPEQSDKAEIIQYGNSTFQAGSAIVGIIGAGNFTKTTLLPILKNEHIKYIASSGGLSAGLLARKYRIPFATTDFTTILADKQVDLVIITTRHDQHALLVIEALRSGKHVFVEKPLAIFPSELDEIIQVWEKMDHARVSLTVGFNRRFSPFVTKMKALLGLTVMNVVITVNAGFIAETSWIQDPSVGGGRIIGEACHFIDLITYLTNSRITAVCMNAMRNSQKHADNASLLLKYENGSTGTIHYFSNGSKDYQKERIEVFANGQVLVLDNFRSLRGYGFKGFSKMVSSQDKGHRAQFKTFLDRIVNGGKPLISFDEIVNTTRGSFAALESLKNNVWVDV